MENYIPVEERKKYTPFLEKFVLSPHTGAAMMTAGRKYFRKSGKRHYFNHSSPKLKLTDEIVNSLWDDGNGSFDPRRTNIFMTIEDAMEYENKVSDSEKKK